MPTADPTIQRLSAVLLKQQWRLAVAESCTGGWFSKMCTDQAGSSAWFESAVISYSNQAKQSILGVPPEVLSRYGAVSEEVALAMAQGVLKVLKGADVGLAISGVAGPAGGSQNKPVGTVCFAVCCPVHDMEKSQRMHFDGDRKVVRRASVSHAACLLLEFVRQLQ